MSASTTDRPTYRNRRRAKLRGVYPAVVSANTGSPNAAFPVEVKFPWLPGTDVAYWARVCTAMAGPEAGTFFMPEVGTQVLVVFEHGNIHRPLIIGGMWGTTDAPPESNANGENNVRVIKSRTGHRLIFEDKGGAERITIVDSSRTQKIVIDSAKDAVIIESSGDINIKSSEHLRMHATSVALKATSAINIEAGGDLDIQTAANMGIGASGAVAVKSGSVAANASGSSAKDKVP